MTTDITVEGTIAIKSIDGKYLKVLPNAGLSFTDQVYDDTAKFTAIKDANGRIRLRSCKSSHHTPRVVIWSSFFSKLKNKPTNCSNTSLTAYNKQYVNMYYVDDVCCSGGSGLGSGAVDFGIIYLADDFFNLTVSGYQGMGNRTKFLSSRAGGAVYRGSLAVVDFEDITCRFTVEKRH